METLGLEFLSMVWSPPSFFSAPSIRCSHERLRDGFEADHIWPSGRGGGGVRKALDATGPRVMLDFEFGGWGDGTFPRAIS